MAGQGGDDAGQGDGVVHGLSSLGIGVVLGLGNSGKSPRPRAPFGTCRTIPEGLSVKTPWNNPD